MTEQSRGPAHPAHQGRTEPATSFRGPAHRPPSRPGPRDDPGTSPADGLPRRITVDPESVERSLASLVLTIIELLRQLMERQALRRVEAGGLSDDRIERLGLTLMALEDRMEELREHFGLSPEDLNIDLGPLGPLLPRS